ncbi:MAG: helix-turn-helix domain-containing protein [Bacteroidota bacterium]
MKTVYKTPPGLPSFEDEVASIPKARYNFIAHSMAVAAAIDDVLQAREMTQKDFAKLMGKQESEISKWLSGTHNFTLRTIAKIEGALELDVLKILSEHELSSKSKDALENEIADDQQAHKQQAQGGA